MSFCSTVSRQKQMDFPTNSRETMFSLIVSKVCPKSSLPPRFDDFWHGNIYTPLSKKYNNYWNWWNSILHYSLTSHLFLRFEIHRNRNVIYNEFFRVIMSTYLKHLWMWWMETLRKINVLDVSQWFKFGNTQGVKSCPSSKIRTTFFFLIFTFSV